MTGDKSNLGSQNQLNSISQRLTEVEERLKTLERAMNPVGKAKNLREKTNPMPKRNPRPLRHNYLKKTIADARRRYEREQS